jgi:hypothetical protein
MESMVLKTLEASPSITVWTAKTTLSEEINLKSASSALKTGEYRGSFGIGTGPVANGSEEVSQLCQAAIEFWLAEESAKSPSSYSMLNEDCGN